MDFLSGDSYESPIVATPPTASTVNEKYTHSPPVSLSQQTSPYPLNSQSNSPYRNGGYSSGMSSTQ